MKNLGTLLTKHVYTKKKKQPGCPFCNTNLLGLSFINDFRQPSPATSATGSDIRDTTILKI